MKTSEVVQVAVEGVDQLETYFGAYLPQFFYAMLAPLTLFACLCFVNIPSAVVLLVCVPLIPVSIAAVQTWAKKLLSKYWGQYTALGDTFLENLQGLTTLKIYRADGLKNEEGHDMGTLCVIFLLIGVPLLKLIIDILRRKTCLKRTAVFFSSIVPMAVIFVAAQLLPQSPFSYGLYTFCMNGGMLVWFLYLLTVNWKG